MPAQNTRNSIYRELADRLRAGGDAEDVCREINALCENCRPTSPVMCMELCQIWGLKREFRDAFEAAARKPSPVDVLNIVKNEKRLKILGVLAEKPYSLEELKHKFEGTSPNQGPSLSGHYIKPLVEASLIREENGLYGITTTGKNAYDLLTKSGITSLPIDRGEHEEKILRVLLSGPKSYDELTRTLSGGSLSRSLEKLRRRGLIAQSGPSGRILYYRTKRRPTRKLSPTELKLFKALPKEGISARDLGGKVEISIGKVYRYLRRLRFKRHVRKAEKTDLYELTDAGRDLVVSLNMAYSLIQS